MNKIEAFIFDLDGVLTDTAEYHYLAWKRLAEEENILFTREDNEKLRGVSRRASLELILKGRQVSEVKMHEYMNHKNSYYRAYLETLSDKDLIPGSLSLLRELQSKRYRLALASASKNASFVIKRLGIISFFEVIADGNSVKKTKPAPDLFLYAAEKMSLPPETCFVVEDAEAGITAAKAAGMATIGIGPPGRVGSADYIYSSVADIRLEDIL
jgi:beta-phosphoglucomutase